MVAPLYARAIAGVLKGAVFEVRQGYKSKDSKRQNADIGNAGTAYTQGYLPVVALLSNQIDRDVADRYVNAGWLLLRGNKSNSSITSTYAFCEQVLGYDIAEFFEKNSFTLKQTVEKVLQALLTPTDTPTIADSPVTTNETDELEATSLSCLGLVAIFGLQSSLVPMHPIPGFSAEHEEGT